MTLQTKILLWLLPLLVVPLLLLGWTSYSKIRESTTRAELIQMVDFTRQISSRIDSSLRMLEANSELLTYSHELRSFLQRTNEQQREQLPQPVLIPLFAYLQSAHPQYEAIGFLSPKGVIEIHTGQLGAELYTAIAPHLNHILTNEQKVFTALVRSPKDARRLLLFSRRLYSPADTGESPTNPAEVRGYVLVLANLEFIKQEISQWPLVPGGVLFLTDSEGKILFHSGGEQGTFPIFKTLLGAASRGEVIRAKHAGQSMFFYGHQAFPDLLVFTALPETTILSGGDSVGILIALIVLAGIGLFVSLTPIAIKQVLLKPMQALVEVARELSKGRKSAPIEINTPDELGALARSLKEMRHSLKKSSKQVRFFAYHDSLTKLPNRLMFSEFLGHALAHAKRYKQSFALLFLDLDDFKRINDTLGHQAGDSVLLELAERLTNCLRADDYVGRPFPETEGDTIARLGGDEFTILLPNITGPYQAATVAERVLASLAIPFVHGIHELHVGASIGITIYPNDGKDAETLIKNADMAMYHAKSQGKNTYQYFKESMNVAAMQQLTLENALRKAIERKEFFLLYQPQVDLRTGKIVAVEALLRWRRPEKGCTLPDKFMNVAEESGLIVPIGRWVIEDACRQNKAWHDAGFKDLTVCVNISGVQFNRQDMKTLVADVLTEIGLSPEFLEIELTETTILRSEQTVTESLNAIKELGVKIAMDDFGTGYSSLNYLRKLPIDKLKVDRSFTCGIGNDPQGEAILSAILAMAHGLQLPVIAEGIESTAQMAFLRKQGCSYIQGNLISKPIDPEGVANLLSQRIKLAM